MRFAAILPERVELSLSQQRLLDAARVRGHTVEVWPVHRLSWRADMNGLAFMLDGAPLPPADVIYWWLPHDEPAGQALVEAMGSAGLPVFPSPTIPFSDKVTQAKLLGAARVPVPETLVVTAEGLLAIAATIAWPRVLKNPQGARGRGVFWVQDMVTVPEVLAEAGLSGATPVVVQEPVYPLGEDIRVFLIDGVIIAAMLRRAVAGEFRANVALGGTGIPTILTSEEEAVALAAWEAMGRAPRAGVDFIRTARGPMVLEVNLWPGFVGLEAATGLDVAGLQVASMEAFAARRR